jgi:DNA adenine methylase
VLIENRPAVDIMRQHDAPDTMHFVDPPYVHSTRVMRAKGGYRHEMTDDQHIELLDSLLELEGYVALSGYPSRLYADKLKHWTSHAMAVRISSGRGSTVRKEVLWLNPACTAALSPRGQKTLWELA